MQDAIFGACVSPHHPEKRSASACHRSRILDMQEQFSASASLASIRQNQGPLRQGFAGPARLR
jgi:hypothetical protein